MAFQGLFGPDLNPPAWFDPALYGLGWFGEDLVAPPGAAASASVSEAAAAADSASGARSTPASVSEAAAAAEASQAAYVGSGAVTEAAAAGDSCDAVVVRGAAVTEPAAAGDAASALAVRLAAVSEPAAAADSASALAVSVAAVAESVTAMDFTAAGALLVASVSEPAAAGDAATGSVPGGSQFAAGVSEPAAAGDAVAASSSTPASVSEAAALDESVAAFSAANAVMLEPMTAGDLWALPPLDCRDLMICGMQKDLDRVLESSSTIGSGNIKLDGNVQGYRSLGQAGVVDGDVVDLYVEDVFPTTGVPTGAWECGSYTWRNGGFLERTTVRASSNNGAAVSWGVGVRRIGLGLLSYMVQAIRAVGGGLSSVEIVAPHVTAVETVAPHVTAIETVAPGVAQVEAVAAVLSNVNAVAGDLAHIDAVALDLTHIDAVALDLAHIDAVALDLVNIDAVAGDKAHIDAVALDLTHIDAVALDLPNIDAVAGDKANVDAVAANLTPINANAANMTAIQGAAPNAAAAAGSASQANANMLTAIAQASLASIYALSAASVAQQDLSGVTAAALHRSPNAVVAMCIDDPRTWSDGGACLQRLDNVSWMNEPLQGAWLTNNDSRGLPTELDARCAPASTSAELSLSTGTPAANATIATDGTVTMLAGGPNSSTTINLSGAVSTTALYRVTATVTKIGGQGAFVRLGSNASTAVQCNLVGTFTFVMQGGGTNSLVYIGPYSQGSDSATLKISVKQITGAFAPSGSYYQSATDGKFYRLWKNLLKSSGDFSQVWTVGASVALSGAVGSQVVTGIAGSLQSPITGLGQTLSNNYPGLMHTLAFEVGNAAARYVIIGTDNGAGFMVNAAFDLQSGTVVGTSAHPSWADTVSASIVAGSAAGRNVISLTFRSLNTATSAVRLIPSTSLPTTSGFSYVATNSGAAGVPVFSAQCEYASSFSSWETKAAADGSQTETFRGNTARFPRMAAFVAEALRVVIYDLLAPGRPMWMVFVGATNALVQSSAISSIAANQGRLLVTQGAGSGLHVIDFAKDSGLWYLNAGLFAFRANIAQRNTVAGADLVSTAISLPTNTTNAVAVTTMPDAPVDAATGLQVPTIAVATNAGLSVIQNDGSVVSSSSAAAATKVAIDYRDLFWLTAPGALYASTPGKLGASFAAANTYTTSAGPALLGAPALVAA